MSRMYFIGVTTGQSAIHRMFPRWCEMAGRSAELIGVDLPVGTPPPAYRQVLERIRDDQDSSGALVTTHKVAVAQSAGDLFQHLSDDSRILGEISCVLRRNGILTGEAPDVDCSYVSLKAIADPRSRDVLLLGSGGAGTALALALQKNGGVTVHATDINPERLEKIATFGARTYLIGHPTDNDAVLARMNPGAIVINSSGLGKDLPGSPITPAAVFPKSAIAWDLNYRGDLKFLDYAKASGVTTADGWNYFVRGWTTTMSRVLDFQLTDELFKEFRQVAGQYR